MINSFFYILEYGNIWIVVYRIIHGQNNIMRTKKYTSHGPTNFVKKTCEMLNNKALSTIVAWTEDGKGFIILDIFAFTNTVLPAYFKHKKLSSFIRQLNMYGFNKLKEDQEDVYLFSHSSFTRDDKESINSIRRKSSETLNSLKKDDIVSMQERLQRFKTQQKSMETSLKNLECLYSQVIEQNQLLVTEIFRSKQREREIENVLRAVTRKKKEEVFRGEYGSLNLEIEPKYSEGMNDEGEWPWTGEISDD